MSEAVTLAAPPHPLKVLAGLLNDPETLRRTWAWGLRVQPGFPRGGSALLTARLLFLAGLEVPYAPHPQAQAAILQQRGWRVLPPDEPPHAGDVFLLVDGPQPRLGLVAKIVTPRTATAPGDRQFYAVDELLAESFRPARRKVAEHDGAVLFWLRQPT